MRQAIGVGFDPQPLAACAEAFQHVTQLQRGIGALRIGPDADILDQRGVLRLTQIGRARQQRQFSVGAEIEALEKAESYRIVAGQIVHALLLEHQQAVEAAREQRPPRRAQPPNSPLPAHATMG